MLDKLALLKGALTLGKLANKTLVDVTQVDVVHIAGALGYQVNNDQATTILAIVNGDADAAEKTVTNFLMEKLEDPEMKKLLGTQQSPTTTAVGEIVRCNHCLNPFQVSKRHLLIENNHEEIVCPHCHQIVDLVH